MKFCQRCGKELMDEAIVCPGCGCPVQTNASTAFNKELDEFEIQKRKAKNKRMIMTASLITCIALTLFFVSIVAINAYKTNKIIEELSGEKFEYNGDTSYSIDRDSYTFDDEGNCEDYSYFYGISMEDPMEFTFDWTYKVEFKNFEAYVILSNDDELKIKYDEEGEITALYNTEERKTYERK